MKISAFLLSYTGLAALCAGSLMASPLENGFLPVPKSRPALEAMTAPADPAPPVPVVAPALKAGLDALSNKDPARALLIRDSMPAAELDRHLLTWAIVMSRQRGVPSHEIAAAQKELTGWPGLARLRGNSEKALFEENPPPADVLAAFGQTAPETVEGSLALVRAYVASDDAAKASPILRRLWAREAMDKPTEDRIIKDYAGFLSVDDHRMRMDFLMFRSRIAQAKRFAELGQAQSLYAAWAAVMQNSSKAPALISAVDVRFRNDPGYLFARIELLRRQSKYTDAAALLRQLPKDREKLVNPAEWWSEQRIVSRGLADRGQFKAAYDVVAASVATDTSDVVEAEFHAGWYALRGLKDGATAARHFKRILDTSSRPLSASRGWYWLGRAAEVGGPGTPQGYFSRAAAYPGTFYGQLAAARLKNNAVSVSYPQPTETDRQRFAAREAVRAIDRLEAAGHGWRANSLYLALAEQLDSPGELALLTARAETGIGHQLSLQIGKIAYGRGIDVAALAFPIGAIPDSANISSSGKALAYAIARQESAFNPAAVSRANARGLLQLLPSTAKAVAVRHAMSFSADKLTTDAGYNATLGAHYLGEQIDAFGGSYILTFVAYNAGPKRVPEWIARYGDPRGKSIDEVVDWIERIPFSETRGYVQRVMENYQIYKSRLGQSADIEHDLRFGRG